MRNMKTMDGNTAAAYIAYAFTEIAAIYPITPSSPMAESFDEWSSKGKKNIFGQKVTVMEMQSEAGAAGALHGSLQSGALTTTFTASQGLLLMIPNMYKIAGELLPCVFHVSARAIATSALNIFGDHSDVMATRQTGFAMLAESSVQEVMDLSAVAHLASIEGRVPFINFFDGFRTSHEIQKIEVLEYNELKEMVNYDAVDDFRRRALNPDHPVTRGSAENPDIYFQQRETCNEYYEKLPEIVEGYMKKINKLTGKSYGLFNYYGAKDAERVIIAMGSICELCEEVVDYLNESGEKVGLVNVHLYRPFSNEYLLKVLPSTVKKIAVLDRTKEPGAKGEPLYLDVVNAFFSKKDAPIIVGGRYGIGSKDTTPAHIIGVFNNLLKDEPKNYFTVGIVDDVTFTSIESGEDIDTTPVGTKACKFWGLGSDGTVGANKSAIKIIGDHTDMYAQGYFAYDSKKSGGITISHLRFGKNKIKSPYLINKADFIACHNQSYVYKYNILNDIKEGGTFLLNTVWNEKELESKLPAHYKRVLANKKIKFYTINAVKIAQEIGLGGRINMIMQSAFFKLSNIIPIEEAIKYLKEAVVTSYGKKGQKVIDMNFEAIDRGVQSIVEINIPEEWKEAKDIEISKAKKVPGFIKNILEPINKQEGDKITVGDLIKNGMVDGTLPAGTAAYEKRGIAINVPEWQMDKCIQCNQCSYVCPHATIRPFLMDEEEIKNAPEGFETKNAVGAKGLNYRIAVDVLDCTGCGNCAEVCPAKDKALIMKPIETQMDKQEIWDYAKNEVKVKKNPMKKETVKGSQFETPLIEFSGACAGCGETPYAKIVTQLFGDRMMVANATGCSSIWGASVPATPYTVNEKGHGPAWANSLFEDNAEFGLGMLLGTNKVRNGLCEKVEKALDLDISEELKEAMKDWIDNKENSNETRFRAEKLSSLLEAEKDKDSLLEEIYKEKDFFIKRSQWIFGGDGWAYDIGYGGLDHVIASGENVNILVFDTEIYSNTGGQASKSSPAAAVAKFAASGKRTKKKDLGMMAMSYGYVYVAQIAMGADKNQTLKAIAEAEAYDGPSLIIAYAPCISHGIKAGMVSSQEETRRAVNCGYWSLYRYNPQLKDQEKNPFILDSKEPKWDEFEDFLMGEVRFASLKKSFPDVADELFKKTKKDAMDRLSSYKRLAMD